MNFQKFLLIFFFSLGTSSLWAQQVVRGTVIDLQTLAPLEGAQVIVLGTDPVMGAISDAKGRFRLPLVPLGRQSIQVTYLGYAPVVRNNLIVNSAQEMVLDIQMEEQIQTLEAVVISSATDKQTTRNELTSVSARSFSVEEALRYAGSRNDPARMAQNFAGVSGVNDNRNDIIIRGNSPTGVLWRLEGIDIPNPNHFGALGTTGGPVSMLNNNNLGEADFLTSAFPAEYGNALAGVFDLGMRNGNNETHEFMGQIGFNGFEVGVEGPLSKNSGASYIANYRYSTLGVFKALGINFGTGAAVPQYQDLTFKLNFPTDKAGRFVLFGLGGNSNINFLDSESGADNFFSGDGQDLYNTGAVGVVGLSHTLLFSNKTYGKLTVAATGIRSGNEIDSLSTVDGTPVRSYANTFTNLRYAAHYQLNHKFGVRDHLRAGLQFDILDTELVDSVRIADSEFRTLRNYQGTTSLAQAYVQWKHKFSDQLTLNTGARFQHFLLNGSQAVEPRLGLRYQFTQAHSLSLGFGQHHQLQPLQTYFLETRLNDGQLVRTNEDLDFTQSTHLVLGYDWRIGDQLRLKVETYYQWLNGAAVESIPSSFSMLNAGADFAFPDRDSLVNEGTATNMGLELTLEKFFGRGYYYLFTASLFDATYVGSDGVERNSAFNGQYILNALGGKEFKLGRNSLSVDLKATYAGGRRFTPIDLEASRMRGQTVRIGDLAFSEQHPDYLRIDLKTTFRMNLKKVTQEWSLDLQNVTNRSNVFGQDYSRTSQEIETTFQIGLFPVVQYRILF
ncbi:MAG: TonB-dependent receptor [Bacteroidota bacterium]